MIRFLKYFLAVVFTGLGCVALSQNEVKKWYFGSNGALDFATNPPTSLANSAMAAWEGCSSVADASGNLLFYTNGLSVWNQSHAVMANGTGLLGDIGSAQGALIVKQPGNPSIYFIFTTDNGGDGLRYSVVDMSLAAGMGAVTVKNTAIHAPSTERLCGVKHCNGTDTWVISNDLGSGAFRANLVTAAGVNTVAVISSAGPGAGGNAGCMKVSPNGRKLAAAHYFPGSFELYDFNAATGMVSNFVNLPVNLPGYGCEFSPDGSKLYGSMWGTASVPNKLCQWDLCAGTEQAISASAVYFNATHTGQLQLGPDGKIYLAKARDKRIQTSPETSIYVITGEPTLGVIHNPNVGGAAANYNNTGQSLISGLSFFGLPNFVSGFYKTPVAQFTYTVNPAISCLKAFFTSPPLINNACSATSYTATNVQWLFDDPASGAANTSALANPEHLYPTTGTYNVRLVLYNDCGGVIDTLKQQVVVGGAVTNSPSTFSICPGQSLTLTAAGTSNYVWSTGATTSSIVVSPAVNTTYTVSNTDAYGCLNKSVLTVTVNPRPVLSVTGNTPICAGNIVTLVARGAVTYSWSTGSTNSAASVTPAVTSTYTVTGTSFNGCSADTAITVTIKPSPIPSIVGSTLACYRTPVTVFADGDSNDTYYWSNGTTGQTMTVIPTRDNHIYSIRVTYANGCIRYQTINFNIVPLPTVSVSGINEICAGDQAVHTASGAITYSWSNGMTSNPASLMPLTSTIFTVSGADANNCVSTATAFVKVRPSATVSVNSLTICSGQSATLGISSPVVPGVFYTWSPVYLNGDYIIFSPPASEVYTVTSNLNGCINTATSNVVVLPSPNLTTDQETIRLLPGSSTELHVSGSTTYSWSPAAYLSCNDCDSPVASPAEDIRYCVSSVIGECRSEVCINVLVSCESDHDYSVPNAFTPNGDNKNDSFCLQGWEECITDFNVMIFDRWGEKLYESGDRSFCWDGVYKGQLLSSGVYVYVIRAKKFNSSAPLVRKGNISLIR